MCYFIGLLDLSQNAWVLYAKGINKNPGGVYKKQKQGFQNSRSVLFVLKSNIRRRKVKRVINLNEISTHIGQATADTTARLRSVSKSKRFTYYSAAAVAFIIAPIAALTLNAKANTAFNLETAPSTPATSDESTTADALLQTAVTATQNTGSNANSNDSNIESKVETSLEVNGEDIDVPENGNVNKVVTNDDGSTTHVVVNSNSSSTSDDDQNTRSNVRVNSSTTVRSYTRSSQ